MTNSSTKITRDDVLDLCETIHATSPDLPAFGARVLGLFLCVRLRACSMVCVSPSVGRTDTDDCY